MGSHFHSLAIPGGRGREVRAAVIEWYERKGFPLSDEEPLFDDEDATDERGVLIATNEKWTVVLHSHRDETERLMWELQRLGGPLVELELYGSDVWGYRLYVDREEVETFCSNPDYFGRQHRVESDPPGGDRLRKVCSLSLSRDELLAIQRERRLFADETVRRFAAAIGAPAAATRFKYALEEEAEGFERLFFARGARANAPPIHSTAFPKRRSSPPPRGGAGLPEHAPADVRVQFALVRTLFLPLTLFFRLLFILLTPIALLVRWLRRKPTTTAPRSVPARVARLEKATLISERYRFRMELPDGATLAPRLFPPPIAFTFRGVEVTVSLSRHERASGLLTIAHDELVVDDESYFAGDLAVRGIATRGTRDVRGKREDVFRQVEVIAGPAALYVLSVTSKVEIPADVREAIRRTAASLELWR